MPKRMLLDGNRVLTIYDSPVEDDFYEYAYGPFFKDKDVGMLDFEEMVIATKE